MRGGGGLRWRPVVPAASPAWQEIPSWNPQQIHLLFISSKARQTWQSYLPTSSPACADAITNVFPSAGDQYVWSQTNNSSLPGGPLPFSRPPLGALTADVRKRINKQRFSWVNTQHTQLWRICTAKDDRYGPYVPYQGSTLLSLVPSYVWVQTTKHRRSVDFSVGQENYELDKHKISFWQWVGALWTVWHSGKF